VIYGIADRFIDSTLPLPELEPADAATPDWRVWMHASPYRARRPRPFHYWVTPFGYRAASFSRDGDRVLLHFARTATFVVDAAARVVECYPLGRTTPGAIRATLLNLVLPLLLSEERLVLHASAVETAAGAVAFVGPPGRGKSTLAAALAMRGLRLIADDFLVVEQKGGAPVAIPSRVEPRLWPDSLHAILPGSRHRFPAVRERSTKRRLSPAHLAGVPLAARPVPIAKICLVASPERVWSLTPFAPAAAVSHVLASTFVVGVDRRDALRTTFERVTKLVANVRTMSLVPAAGFGELERMCDAIAGEVLSRAG
jgi:hypothetical protein